MNLNLLFPACALLTSVYILLSVRKAQAHNSQRRLQGLRHITHLRCLLEALPQHRGMANALLQGDESFRSKLTTLQAQIDRDMSVMEKHLLTTDHWGVTDRAQRVLSAWSTIKQKLNNFAAPESFGRHTALITELLYLINDVADAAGLLEDPDNTRLIDTAINMLPLVTETLGQARGMGTGVAARGKCSSDMRVKLRYLLANTRRVAEEVGQAVQGTLSQRGAEHHADFKTRAGNALGDSQQATQEFLSLLETGIIHDNSIDVVPTDFYAAGTTAIQHSFTLLDTILTSLNFRLNQSAQKNKKHHWLSRGIALVLIMPALYLLQQLFTTV